MASKKKAAPVEEPEEVLEEVGTDAMEGIADEALLALGTEMNKIMFPDDMIDYDALDSNALLEQITADAKNIDPADPFSEESKETLAALGVEIEWAAVKPAKGKKEKAPKAEKPAKVVKEKIKKEKSEKKEFDPTKSNKAIVYTAWKAGKTEVAELFKLTGEAVKESTIKAWIQAWKNDKNLPAVAKAA